MAFGPEWKEWGGGMLGFWVYGFPLHHSAHPNHHPAPLVVPQPSQGGWEDFGGAIQQVHCAVSSSRTGMLLPSQVSRAPAWCLA